MLETSASSSSPERRELDFTNIAFLSLAHAVAGLGVWWAFTHFNALTLALSVLWFALCGFGITAGYHRLFAHRSYEAAPWLRAAALLFGAGSVQNSALHWANNHRLHHARQDREGDPYDINRGFFWAHIGWVLYKDDPQGFKRVRDMQADPLVMWQHRNYVVLTVVVGALLPMALGALWGDAWGGLLVAGFLRLIFQYHATFATNSLAHTLGSRPYDSSITARDHFLTAIFTLGEGYHNFHHRFQNDYRNGVRAWDFDPTKWLIWCFARVGAASNLRRTTAEKLQHAMARAALDADLTQSSPAS